MRLSVILLLLSFPSAAQVNVAGEMRNIMQKADLSPTIELDTINKSGLYGLGAVEGLKGEIIIIDGKCFVTSVNDAELQTTNTFDVKAAMFVYQNVTTWSNTNNIKSIQDLNALEQYLEAVRIESGKSLDVPLLS